jgi:hypothetical protein
MKYLGTKTNDTDVATQADTGEKPVFRRVDLYQSPWNASYGDFRCYVYDDRITETSLIVGWFPNQAMADTLKVSPYLTVNAPGMNMPGMIEVTTYAEPTGTVWFNYVILDGADADSG